MHGPHTTTKICSCIYTCIWSLKVWTFSSSNVNLVWNKKSIKNEEDQKVNKSALFFLRHKSASHHHNAEFMLCATIKKNLSCKYDRPKDIIQTKCIKEHSHVLLKWLQLKKDENINIDCRCEYIELLLVKICGYVKSCSQTSSFSPGVWCTLEYTTFFYTFLF